MFIGTCPSTYGGTRLCMRGGMSPCVCSAWTVARAMHEHRMHGGRCLSMPLSMRDGTHPWTRGGMSPYVCSARTVALRCTNGGTLWCTDGGMPRCTEDGTPWCTDGGTHGTGICVICLLYVCTRKLILNPLISLFVFILMLR